MSDDDNTDTTEEVVEVESGPPQPMSTTTDDVSLSEVMQYIKGQVPEEQQSFSRIQNMLSNYKSHLSAMSVLVAYKQMNRLARMLDFLDKLEAHLFDPASADEVVANTDRQELLMQAQSLQDQSLQILMNVLKIMKMSGQGRIENDPQIQQAPQSNRVVDHTTGDSKLDPDMTSRMGRVADTLEEELGDEIDE